MSAQAERLKEMFTSMTSRIQRELGNTGVSKTEYRDTLDELKDLAEEFTADLESRLECVEQELAEDE